MAGGARSTSVISAARSLLRSTSRRRAPTSSSSTCSAGTRTCREHRQGRGTGIAPTCDELRRTPRSPPSGWPTEVDRSDTSTAPPTVIETHSQETAIGAGLRAFAPGCQRQSNRTTTLWQGETPGQRPSRRSTGRVNLGQICPSDAEFTQVTGLGILPFVARPRLVIGVLGDSYAPSPAT